MKNMKKLVALFAATAMTMSLSLSAFAAEVNTTVEGDGDTTESFNLVFTAPDGGEADIDQLTMIAYLVAADTDPEEIPDYSSQTIVAMDQIGGDEVFGTVPVDVEKLEEGYAIAVAMGGTDVSTVAKYLVTYDAEEETLTIVIGDVDGDNDADNDDAAAIKFKLIGGAQKITGAPYAIGEKVTDLITCGDVDGDGDADNDDAAAIKFKLIGGAQKITGAPYAIGETVEYKK